MDNLGYELPENSKEIPGVSFRVIADTTETEYLMEMYENQRHEISIIYQSDDFLEKVLTKLLE